MKNEILTTIATSAEIEAVRSAIEIKAMMEELKVELAKKEEILKNSLKNNGVAKALIDGHKVSLTESIRSTFDTDRFKQDFGEDSYKEYTKVSSYTRFTIS